MDSNNQPYQFPTFKEKVGAHVCTDSQGRPIIRMFAVVECEKCRKVEKTFIPVVTEYMEQGLVTGHLWFKDKGDDLLTPEHEGGFPLEEEEICFEFDSRCENSLVVVGCQFYRTGAPYGTDYQSEEEEIRGVIEAVLARAPQKPSPEALSEPTRSPVLVLTVGGVIIAALVLLVIFKVFRRRSQTFY